MYEKRSGWVTFAGVLLLISGSLSVIYGIAGIGNSKFFVRNAQFIIGDLKTWGWVTLIIGLIQVLAAGSLWRGGIFGRIFAIGAASLSAIGALLAIPAYPFLSLAVFALDLVVINQIATRGTAGRGENAPPPTPSSTKLAMEGMADYRQ